MTGHWRDFVDPRAPIGRYLDWDAVEKSAGLSRTTAWRLRRVGDFPDPYSLSPGRVAYRETEIEAWKSWRAEHRSQAAAPQRVQVLSKAPADPLRESPVLPPVLTPSIDPLPLFAALTAAPRSDPRPRRARRSRGPGPDQTAFDF